MMTTPSHQVPFSRFHLKALRILSWEVQKKLVLCEKHKFQLVTKGVIAHVPFAHDLTQSFSVLPKQSLL